MAAPYRIRNWQEYNAALVQRSEEIESGLESSVKQDE